MADIFDIDFALQNRNLIAEAHRQEPTLKFTEAITDALQDLRDLLFGDYKTGSTAAIYVNATTYAKYNRAAWTDKGVYELQVASSMGVHPTGDALSATNWTKIIDNYVGADERQAYNSRLIVLTAAINKWFGVTSNPYIYITNNNGAGVGFTLNVPSAVYTALGSSNPIRDARLGEFISKFTAAGINYSISTY